jgi:hypothetical protein
VHRMSDFRMHSGREITFRDPRQADIDVGDIAHHLARIGRFGGATDGFYSVASHSVYVSRRLAEAGFSARTQLAGLLHDSAEAYLGDVVSHLKALLPGYHALEEAWDDVLQTVFRVQWRGNSVIKEADLRARLSEARDLFRERPYELNRPLMYNGLEPFEEPVVEQTPDEAEFSWLSRAAELGVLLP